MPRTVMLGHDGDDVDLSRVGTVREHGEKAQIPAVEGGDDGGGTVGHRHVVLDGLGNPEPGGKGVEDRAADGAGAARLVSETEIRHRHASGAGSPGAPGMPGRRSGDR